MKKKLAYLLFCALFILLLPLHAGAEEIQPEWILSEDGETLSYEGTVYRWYPLAPGDYLQPKLRLIHDQEINLWEDEDLTLITADGNSDFVFLCDYVSTQRVSRVYATEAGAEILDRYTAGEFSAMTLWNREENTETTLYIDMVRQWDQTEAELTLDVKRLQDAPRHDVMGYDETKSLQHTHGAIYLLHDGYYYVNYDPLDNSHFDTYGNFSYRSGTVALVKLTAAQRSAIDDVIARQEHRYVDYEFLSEYLHEEEDAPNLEAATVGFTISTAILGYILPLAMLVVAGVALLRKRSSGHKRWIALLSLSGIWILMATMILLAVTGG